MRDLWVNNHTSWNKDRVRELYGCFVGDQICYFPMAQMIKWSGSITPIASTPLSPPIRGFFSNMWFGPHRFFWMTIWKLKTLPKIRVFAWRVGHELLPPNTKISSIRQDFSKDCPKCGASVETLVHALKDRQTARTILTLGGLDGRLLNKDYPYRIDWIEDVMCFLDKKVVTDFITTLSDSWNNRNNYVFRGKEEEARVI